MGCLKLQYYTEQEPFFLKVAEPDKESGTKGVQGFLRVDPLTAEYPWYTPYQFAGNKPIWAVDLDGKEEKIMTNVLYEFCGEVKETKVQKWSDLYPGEEHGPLGSGTLTMNTIGPRWDYSVKRFQTHYTCEYFEAPKEKKSFT